jgi:hypothetical protein
MAAAARAERARRKAGGACQNKPRAHKCK